MQQADGARPRGSLESREQRVWAPQRGFSLLDMLMVVAVVAVVSVMIVPMTRTAVAGERFRADAQALTNTVGLAKMRASAGFTRARVRANLATHMFVLERWDKVSETWLPEGGQVTLHTGSVFGFGGLSAAPPNTQAAIGFSPPCRTKTGTGSGDAAIAGTACVVFNSRGLPVDGNGLLFAGHAIYVTDGSEVAAVTVTATPRIRRWSSRASVPSWKELQ